MFFRGWTVSSEDRKLLQFYWFILISLASLTASLMVFNGRPEGATVFTNHSAVAAATIYSVHSELYCSV